MGAVPDIVPITDLRQDASGIVRRASSSGSPIFITQHGRATAVVVSAKAYERTQRELEVLRLLARGQSEAEAGAGYGLDDVLEDADRLLEEA